MTDEHKKLLAIFETRVRDLIKLCDKQRERIDELEQILTHKEEEIEQTMKTIETLNAKYDKLLTAHVVSADEGEMRSARMRLSKLVREVDKCIALLNE